MNKIQQTLYNAFQAPIEKIIKLLPGVVPMFKSMAIYMGDMARNAIEWLTKP
jgi:hypothetical protein